jgi:queuine/archaeosine tRNA-ribosyltransferase
LHLLGISRCEHLPAFAPLGVVSFDSTSPLRQAFKDERDNYYTSRRNYAAIRVPQVDGNTQLKADIKAGRVNQSRARTLEQLCLRRLNEFDSGECTVQAVIDPLTAYGHLIDLDGDRTTEYRELLETAPWKRCSCGICERVGIQIVIFRGTERNKRRGFHNLYVFSRRLKKRLNVPNPKSALN